MQLDYYRRPVALQESGEATHFGSTPPSAPSEATQPRRRKRGRLVLTLFLFLILLFAAALVVLRVLFPESWNFSLDQLIQEIDGFEYSFEIPNDSFDASEPPSYPLNTSSTPITIPRAELAPDIQMHLTATPEQVLSFQEIYEKVIPSIVSIQAYSDYGAYEGTGVIMTADGYVITNHHIIAGCSSAAVVLSDGTRYEAKLVGSDAESDLAVLKADAANLAPAEFGSSDLLRVGDTALAIGNPLGSELFGTMTEGIISAINRDVNVEGYNMSLIQTTAALNPGNSGGALINRVGQVVGITNMKMMSDYETIEGLGFAIPTTWVKEVVDTLLAKGVITGRPTIGFTCFTLEPEDAVLYGRGSGVCIESVTAGGPAALAGVLPGDIVIAANSQSITSLDDLTLVRDEAGVGGTLELTIWRNGETLKLTLTLVDQYQLD